MANKVQPLPPGTTRAAGTDGEVLFDGAFVTVKHNWKAQSGRGESRYPLGSVTGVEVKPGVLSGLFTLVVAGGVQRGDSKQARKGDPLSVRFAGTTARTAFTEMRDRIIQALGDRERPTAPVVTVTPAPVTAPGLGDQLAQVAELHAQGILSDAEFAAAKSRLLATTQEPIPEDARPPGTAW